VINQATAEPTKLYKVAMGPKAPETSQKKGKVTMGSPKPETSKTKGEDANHLLGQMIGIKTAKYLLRQSRFNGTNDIHVVLGIDREGSDEDHYFWYFIHMKQINEKHYTQSIWTMLKQPQTDDFLTLKLERSEVTSEMARLHSKNLASMKLGDVVCSDAAVDIFFSSYRTYEGPGASDLTYEEKTRKDHAEDALKALNKNFEKSCADCKGLPREPACKVCKGNSAEPILDTFVDGDILDHDIFRKFRNSS
jgi:hypothetical protein